MIVPETGARTRCVIVIPCYEEERRLDRAAFRVFLEREPEVHLLFVNDGSRDGTLALLEAMRQENPERIAVLDKQPNGGKGEAIRAGMRVAMADPACRFTGFWDADLATPLEAIPQLLQVLDAEPELQMVFGARIRLLGRHIDRKAARHYAGRIFATAASLTLSIPIYDTQCGAKIFRVTPELEAVLAEPFGSKWIFDVELLARLVERRGAAWCIASIYEFPLERWEDVGGSKLRSFDFLLAAGDLWKIHRRYLSGRGRS